MNYKTKRRINNKNKTKKCLNSKEIYYGGNENKNGIFDIIGNKISDFASGTANFVGDKITRLAGYERIKNSKKEKEELEKIELEKEELEKIEKNKNINNDSSNSVSGIFSTAQKIGSDVVDVANKTSAAVVEQVNDVLESPKVQNSLSEAAADTAESGEKLLENINEKLNDPLLKKETELVLDNVGDYAEIAVDSLNKPLNKGIDDLNEAGSNAVAGLASGAVKVGTDVIAAIPGFGSVIEIGKMINDGSKAVGDVVEAGTDSVSTVSDIVKETSKNIHEGIEKLDEEKHKLEDLNPVKGGNNYKYFKEIQKAGKKITNRIEKSLTTFENNNSILKGGKTKHRFNIKHKKTKKVRFAI